jgi:hypothetical protein
MIGIQNKRYFLSLAEWVDDVAFSPWRVIDIQKLVTEGAAPQNPSYQTMDRTVNNNPSGDRNIPDDTRIHDERTVTVPTGDKVSGWLFHTSLK